MGCNSQLADSLPLSGLNYFLSVFWTQNVLSEQITGQSFATLIEVISFVQQNCLSAVNLVWFFRHSECFKGFTALNASYVSLFPNSYDVNYDVSLISLPNSVFTGEKNKFLTHLVIGVLISAVVRLKWMMEQNTSTPEFSVLSPAVAMWSCTVTKTRRGRRRRLPTSDVFSAFLCVCVCNFLVSGAQVMDCFNELGLKFENEAEVCKHGERVC